MPAFEFRGGVREDGSWTIEPVAPDGSTVLHADIARVLVLGVEFYTRAPAQRLLTVSEVAALRAREEASRIPPGWEPTADGIDVHLVLGGLGGASHSRRYQRGEEVVAAPCDANGNPTPETREVLLAADAPPTPEA